MASFRLAKSSSPLRLLESLGLFEIRPGRLIQTGLRNHNMYSFSLAAVEGTPNKNPVLVISAPSIMGNIPLQKDTSRLFKFG